MTPQKKTTKRRTAGRKAAPRSRRAPEAAAPPEDVMAPAAEIAAEPPEGTSLPPDLATIDVEPAFAGRMLPPEPERPFPSARRAIFLDVENASRAEHIGRMLEHLAVDRLDRRTDFVAVGNWRVIGHDTARLLARHGAHLVHSAPAVGVRDWSDLRIAVGAGAWLASARPGDLIEIVSDDRAFDAVGDVSASLGITFRRLSYRSLTGGAARHEQVVEREPREQASAPGRRGRRGGWRDRPAPSRPAAAAVTAEPAARSHDGRQLTAEPHTAPHDEIVTIVQDLVQAAPGRVVTIDTLANALKSRGFSRPPGSPRLSTRLRRIKEITVSRSGAITLTGGDNGQEVESPLPTGHAVGRTDRAPERSDRGHERVGGPVHPPEDLSVGPGNEAPPDGGSAPTARPGPAEGGSRRRRRSRRGGRRHRGRGAKAPAPAP